MVIELKKRERKTRRDSNCLPSLQLIICSARGADTRQSAMFEMKGWRNGQGKESELINNNKKLNDQFNILYVLLLLQLQLDILPALYQCIFSIQ